MIIGIDMGHSTYDSSPCGAIGYLNESKENRRIGLVLIQKLRDLGHTVIDCSCNSAKDVDSQLIAIVNKANSYDLDLFLSLHLNAGGGKGAEIYSYSGNSYANNLINTYCKETGFVNRGHKNANYFVLRATKAPAILLEMCFVDTKTDADLWNSLTPDFIANAICKGLVGKTVSNATTTTETKTNYLVKITADVLNVRNGAGIGYAVNTTVKKNEVFTITKEKDGWGYLKSGAGWISLSYTTKDIKQNVSEEESNIKEYAETGTATVIVNSLNVRDNPNLNSNIVANYFNGESFTYNYVRIDDNRVWVRYTSYGGQTRWVCVKENNTRYANCY